MSTVRRLPVQHPQAPHCPTCEAPLPNLNSMSLVMGPEAGTFEIRAITLLIQCKCGAEWNLTKRAK
jgi:hypothetical protein